MATLTEDQQRAFGNRMSEIAEDPETQAALNAAESGLDLGKRKAKLAAKKTAADSAENEQTRAKVQLARTTGASVAATGDYYTEASDVAGAICKGLGEKHPLSRRIHRLRPEMSNEAARGSRKTAAVKTTGNS